MRYLIGLISLFLLCACGQAASEFQKDADIVRLRHIQHYGNLITEYNRKSGTFPLMGETHLPTYVLIASPEQFDDIQERLPIEYRSLSFVHLVQELERVLGRQIDEYYDPQFEPDGKPNFYIYMTEGESYYLAVHTDEAFAFSNPISQGYNKVEISNTPDHAPHLLAPEVLFAREDFKAAIARPISKPGFFDSRDAQFLHATKNQ